MPDALALVDDLRQVLAAGTRSIDSILRTATDAARVLSGAHGTALALRTNGVIVCRARSGDIAPELGARLNLASGISGACLRTGDLMVCSDAATDKRVDPDVCHALGVRSIIVVPVRGATGIAGILEAFSTRPYAFGAGQIDSLRAIAEIAEMAHDREGYSQSPLPDRLTSSAAWLARFAEPITADQILETTLSEEWHPKRRYLIPAVVAVAVLLVSLVVWLGWGGPEEIAAHEAPPPSVSSPIAPSGHPTPRVSPSYSGPVHQSDRMRTKDAPQNAAEIEPATDDAISSISTRKASAVKSAGNPAMPTVSLGSDSGPPPPIEALTQIDPDKLAGFSSASTAQPTFGASVSGGVTDGSLIRKVDPAYPIEAKAQGLAGSVIVDADIAQDGSVREVKVVSGDPLFAAAASAAVRQWRFRPSLLNGKPIAVQKRITILFKLP